MSDEINETNIEDFFKLEDTKKLSEMVDKWIEANGSSPFTDIFMQPESDGSVEVEMVGGFEDAMVEQFKDDTSEVLGDYISAIVESTVKTLEDAKSKRDELKD